VVPGALFTQAKDPAFSYGWTEEIFTQNNKSQKVNLLRSCRKPSKRFAQKCTFELQRSVTTTGSIWQYQARGLNGRTFHQVQI
jgi:hypothetical protein